MIFSTSLFSIFIYSTRVINTGREIKSYAKCAGGFCVSEKLVSWTETTEEWRNYVLNARANKSIQTCLPIQ